jgi:putative PIN family toxin of toxin-antitoxin system
LRVVLDTNVLVSAFIFPGGAPEQVYRLALEGRLDLVTSRVLLAEFGRVLVEKFGWDASRAEIAVAQVARIATVVEPSERLDVIHDDPEDNRVLEAAIEASADVIVSGDRHLRRLKVWRDVTVLDPAQYLSTHG